MFSVDHTSRTPTMYWVSGWAQLAEPLLLCVAVDSLTSVRLQMQHVRCCERRETSGYTAETLSGGSVARRF